MVNLQLLSHLFYAVLLHQLSNAEHRQEQKTQIFGSTVEEQTGDPLVCFMSANLLVFGDRVQKLRVQFGIVLGQGLMAIVIDELHHRQEGKRLGEAVPPLSVVNLY